MNNRPPATEPHAADETTIFSLLRAAHALEDKLEQTLSEVGLSSAKFSVLSELAKAGEPLPLSELAARLSCVRSNMTQLVDRLEADGFVQRVACPNDRRSVKAALTPEGTRRRNAGAHAVARLQAEFSGKLSAGDRAALARTLGVLG
ncbi:MAG TPA: MarR family transcriptional regulator [Gemmatimonadaceae bacterium]|nr:MarR family transcriptional regulator [Gemmatimonadaceae bacterium]